MKDALIGFAVAVVVGGKTRIRGWFAAERKLDHLLNMNFNGLLMVYGLPATVSPGVRL